MARGIEVLLELKDKFSGGISKVSKNTNENIKKMKNNVTKLKGSFSNAFGQMRSELPLVGRAIDLLTNKWVLMGAGIVGVGFMLKTATSKASEFNSEFLHIKNLNLDKSKSELDNYKKTIKNTAFEVGLDLNKTTQAFYDVQSATGFFGKEAEEVVKQVGKFSIATGADLNDSINATTKALKAFGLEAKDTTMLLESNAKTVQVGITTFAELTQVQTEYAGAASGVGQSVNTANKIFAAFTSIAKDSRTASTMTKTAFQGLTQKGTVDGLKSIGISLYDNNGQMRDLAMVLQEVSGKFKDMNPREIDTLINKIGGPEGLRNLFVKLKTGSEDFFSTLKAFDSSKFNMDKALKNAQGDFKKLSEIVKNRWGVIMTNLGEKILPIVARALNKVNDFLVYFNNNSTKVINTLKILEGMFLSYKVGVIASTVAMKKFNLVMKTNPWGIAIAGVTILILKLIELNGQQEKYRKENELLMKQEQEKLNSKFKYHNNIESTIKFDTAKLEDKDLTKEQFNKIKDDTLNKIKMLNDASLKLRTSLKTDEVYKKLSVNRYGNLDKITDYERKLTGGLTKTNISSLKLQINETLKKLNSKKFSKYNKDSTLIGDNMDTLNQEGEQVSKVVGSAGQVRSITIQNLTLQKGDINVNGDDRFNEKDPEQLQHNMSDYFLGMMKLIEKDLANG